MIDDFDKEIELELLKRISENGKVNLMTEINSIMNNSNLSCLSHSSLTTFVQKQFLQSNLSFKYKLLNSRNGIKIIELREGHKVTKKDMDILGDFAGVSENEAAHIINQFEDVNFKVNIAEIALIYNIITKNTEVTHFYCLNEELINFVYKNSDDYFESKAHIEGVINDIIKYGYCFKRNNQYYWKMYIKTSMEEADINQFFTVNEKSVDMKQPVEQNKVVQELTAQDALNILAKELGFASIENTKSKLEEVLAITNELIDNFNSMQDWEKLMNWNNFVNDWKTIMGDALNDNN